MKSTSRIPLDLTRARELRTSAACLGLKDFTITSPREHSCCHVSASFGPRRDTSRIACDKLFALIHGIDDSVSTETGRAIDIEMLRKIDWINRQMMITNNMLVSYEIQI